MNILIVYSIKTEKEEELIRAITENLKIRGHLVETEVVKPRKEHNSFFRKISSFFKEDRGIKTPNIKDVSKYDAICVGSQNWLKLPLFIVKYLKTVNGLSGKRVSFFAMTRFWPQVGWYFFSTRLLGMTSFGIIENSGMKVIDSMLLSSGFKKWGINSSYGVKEINRFCNNIEKPIASLRNFMLREERENAKLSLVFFSAILIFSLLFQAISDFFGELIISWGEYFYFFLVILFVQLSFITILISQKRLFLVKYLSVLALMFILTATILIFTPLSGSVIIAGYILTFVLLGFFRDPQVVFFAGLAAILSYLFLFLNCFVENTFLLNLDIFLIFLGSLIGVFVTDNLKKNHLKLAKAREESEISKATLEIRIKARTRELREMSQQLEGQVKERTMELENKIKELERFNKLAVGRELKMVFLKRELQKLEEKLKKKK
ncbi:MAG: hypothetical protein ABH831_01375 [Candidatus Nealsonbacteria bacterium]